MIWNRRVEYWAIYSSARSFARTAHSFDCSALLGSLARIAAPIRSLACSLTRSQARGKEIYVYKLKSSIPYSFNQLCKGVAETHEGRAFWTSEIDRGRVQFNFITPLQSILKRSYCKEMLQGRCLTWKRQYTSVFSVFDHFSAILHHLTLVACQILVNFLVFHLSITQRDTFRQYIRSKMHF